jgi:hypothetical protein
MTTAATVRRIAKGLPVVRNLRHAPPYFTGSVLANQLGYQVLRVLGKRFLWTLRRQAVAREALQYVQILRRDGVVAIPNYLPPEQFATVRAEFESIRTRLDYRPLPFYCNLQQVQRGRIHAATFSITDHPEMFPAAIQNLVRNSLLWKIVSGVVRVPMCGQPSASIDVYQKRDDDAPDNDVETVLHADLHSSTVKGFFYLNDVDERNGAFIYAKGSARIGLSRLRHEYDMSIRAAKMRRGDTDLDPEWLAVRGPNRRNMVRPSHRKSMGIVETSICGKANTLIIADNLGFHRRGDFLCDTPRETILLNFRHLQRPFWS